jgi:hypothetical protein
MALWDDVINTDQAIMSSINVGLLVNLIHNMNDLALLVTYPRDGSIVQ